MLFRPNTTCQVEYAETGFDIYGRQVFSAPETVRCAVVSFDLAVQKSSVRADSSGSRGRAEQLEGVARFLFRPNVPIKTGDVVTKGNFVMSVIEVHPRYSVAGELDHNEVDMKKTEPTDGVKD